MTFTFWMWLFAILFLLWVIALYICWPVSGIYLAQAVGIVLIGGLCAIIFEILTGRP